jgi:hypothetical protein
MRFQCSWHLDIFMWDCNLGQYITYVYVDVKVYMHIDLQPNAAVERLVLLLRVREVPYSNLVSENGYPEYGLCSFCKALQANMRTRLFLFTSYPIQDPQMILPFNATIWVIESIVKNINMYNKYCGEGKK